MKKIFVNHPWIPDRQQLYKLFDDILESKELTDNKKYVQLLEKKLINYTNSPYAFATANGTLALQIAIRALNITEGEIITTPHSYVASASSILWQNCKPVFVDIEPDTLCIRPDLIEEKITGKTKAILAVHVYGRVCDINAIEDIAAKYNLPTIYDGAHALGSTYNHESVFKFGTISTLSLHASKIVSSGEGGAIFCQDKEIADRIYKIRCFGKDINNEVVTVGINGKMSEFNAAYGLLSLAHLEGEMVARREIAKRYSEAFGGSVKIQMLSSRHNTDINFAYFPIILPDEKDVTRLIKKGNAHNIYFRRYWYPSLTMFPFLNSFNNTTPVSDVISKRILCIPIYQELAVDDQHKIIKLIFSIF